MSDLLQQVLGAYGGLDRWRRRETLSARVRGGGRLWRLKGQEGVMDDVVAHLDLHRQSISHTPSGPPGPRSVFTPERVAVETLAGEVVEERHGPRESFAGHRLETPWDRLHAAYFTGYALWTYLTEPFSLAGPGVAAEEWGTWREQGETWRRLKVVFPKDFAAHRRENVYHVDAEGLIRRHDYVSEVFGPDAPAVAHYVSDHREVDGIVVPATRRVHPVGADGHPVRERLIVGLDVEDVAFR